MYEFYGGQFHGCQKCYKQGQQLYNTTKERENILKAAGYKVESIWECQWNESKTTMINTTRKNLESQAAIEHTDIRDSLFGGRTEAFKYYCKCK